MNFRAWNWILEEVYRALGLKPCGGDWGQVGTRVSAWTPCAQFTVATQPVAGCEAASVRASFFPTQSPSSACVESSI